MALDQVCFTQSVRLKPFLDGGANVYGLRAKVLDQLAATETALLAVGFKNATDQLRQAAGELRARIVGVHDQVLANSELEQERDWLGAISPWLELLSDLGPPLGATAEPLQMWNDFLRTTPPLSFCLDWGQEKVFGIDELADEVYAAFRLMARGESIVFTIPSRSRVRQERILSVKHQEVTGKTTTKELVTQEKGFSGIMVSLYYCLKPRLSSASAFMDRGVRVVGGLPAEVALLTVQASERQERSKSGQWRLAQAVDFSLIWNPPS